VSGRNSRNAVHRALLPNSARKREVVERRPKPGRPRHRPCRPAFGQGVPARKSSRSAARRPASSKPYSRRVDRAPLLAVKPVSACQVDQKSGCFRTSSNGASSMRAETGEESVEWPNGMDRPGWSIKGRAAAARIQRSGATSLSMAPPRLPCRRSRSATIKVAEVNRIGA